MYDFFYVKIFFFSVITFKAKIKYGDFRSEIVAKKAGYILGLNNQPVVNKGDALINIGYAKIEHNGL